MCTESPCVQDTFSNNEAMQLRLTIYFLFLAMVLPTYTQIMTIHMHIKVLKSHQLECD
jgi:predicted transporter